MIKPISNKLTQWCLPFFYINFDFGDIFLETESSIGYTYSVELKVVWSVEEVRL